MTDEIDRDYAADRVSGAAGSNVQTLRLPGQVPAEAYIAATEHMVNAMCFTASVNRVAAAAYLMALRTAIMAASYTQNAPAEKVLNTMMKRLEQHLATLPNQPPPGAA